MALCSPLFLLLLWSLGTVFALSPRRPERRLLLLVANLAFLWTFVSRWEAAVVLGAFLGLTYGLLALGRHRPAAVRPAIGIAVVVLGFLLVKGYWFVTWLFPLDSLLDGVQVVGLSYMLFKFIHMLVDQSEGQLARWDLASYLNYQLAFFTLVAGPIQRYNEFQASWDAAAAAPVEACEALSCWSRVLTGVLKMGGLALLVDQLLQGASRPAEGATLGAALRSFAAHFYLYPMYLYFNFSGYTDIVIGGARLLGYRLPENFNRPFLARNPGDFWDRWHISLTRWIRDYIFMASYKWVAERWRGKSKKAGVGLLFVSFLIAGAWHGATERFFVFGLLHGLAAATGRAYGDLLTTRLGRVGVQRYLESKWIEAGAKALTFHFVCATFLFFSLGVGGTQAEVAAVLTRLPAGAGVAAIVCGAVVGLLGLGALAFALQSEVRRRLVFLHELSKRLQETMSTAAVLVVSRVALVTLLLVGLWAFGQSDPVVAYMRF